MPHAWYDSLLVDTRWELSQDSVARLNRALPVKLKCLQDIPQNQWAVKCKSLWSTIIAPHWLVIPKYAVHSRNTPKSLDCVIYAIAPYVNWVSHCITLTHCPKICHASILFIIWARPWEKCLMSYANNKGADQPAHPRSLISAFVFRCLGSVMSLVSVTKISSLILASVAEHASLSLTWSETPEDTFSHDQAHINMQNHLTMTKR